MSQARLEKLGTIFSRVTTLLRSGVMPREDKPIWYDVYHVFPPKTEPSYANRRPMPEIQEILYPEDVIRAKFHRRMEKRLPIGDLLKEPTNDLTKRAINIAQDLMRKDSSLNEDQAIEKVIEIFKGEKAIRPRWYEREPDYKSKDAQTELDLAQEPNYKSKDAQTELDLVQEYEGPVKTITDQNIDVSKFVKKK